MKLKNINRGLVLGAVLVIGTAGYVVKTRQDFKADKSVIEDSVRQSISALSEVNTADTDAKRQKIYDFLNEYFTDYSNENDYGWKKSDYLSLAGDDSNFSQGGVTKCEYEITDISLKQWGPNGAMAELSFSAYYEYWGDHPDILDLWGMTYAQGGADYYSPEDIPENERDMSFKENISGDCSMYLVEKDGKWKIASVQYMNWWENDFAPLDDSVSDGEEAYADGE